MIERVVADPVVHLELRTTNAIRACAFYTQLFGWRTETVRARDARYQVLGLGVAIEGGVVECEDGTPIWLPYVEVADIAETTARARRLGATVKLEPREGPAGWRSRLVVPGGSEIALWQPKI